MKDKEFDVFGQIGKGALERVKIWLELEENIGPVFRTNKQVKYFLELSLICLPIPVPQANATVPQCTEEQQVGDVECEPFHNILKTKFRFSILKVSFSTCIEKAHVFKTRRRIQLDTLAILDFVQ